ncbi:MAG: ABC transporter ATP-binding protein [Bacteroidetes bacterium GWC2_33_15]|nr:MAG: ABC transporter ATP-binding protein [Bacteroidetes bacterium GWA2_33_15]OFX50393.1 MAG: ABC transporter ATP-binding protein [Bacteroidetes bacterium GWC2_33_15]OFX66689.1 MAG: ABC transporter ATP-binding protein [Bacteroidetes bacterium GWB2_32_14]OFX69307.1 MAG: ABC transporter ATP-binding protein [Bacteroidetes bacterium GWD2_33_33]HAN18623.1 ABC transporter ATP-binding protein [Bacteroidales bacterium]
MPFPFYQQLDAMDCGPSCLRMIAKHYGKSFSLQTLRDKSYITREGVSMLGISDAAEAIGFRSMGVRITFEQLLNEAPMPCIAHWKQNHFVVVYKIKQILPSPFRKGGVFVHVADPARGLIKFTKEEFMSGWANTKEAGEDKGLCLLLETTPDFYKSDNEKLNKSGFKFLFSYLRPYKKLIIQLVLGLLLGSLLQLIFPFLTQSIVDKGINNQDLSFVTLIIIAQLVLIFSRTIVEFIRSWILLHLGTRINISLISDFLIKLMKLPVSFFDTKMIGDLIQRIGDHKRIENFLTSSTLNILFSFVNLIIFGIVLLTYSVNIFLIFLIGSTLYTLWIYLFMKKRRDLDNRKFAQLSSNQSNVIQLITGMQEIKLNNCEKQKRWEWESIQAKLFKVNMDSLSLSQYQQAGGVFINEIKNIAITFIAAKSVIDGQMTLGMMLAVQYIIGQLNSPINQMIGFLQATQDAKISLERLGEIHQRDNEESDETPKISILPEHRDLNIDLISFQYEGPHSPFVLENVELNIPEKKITAVVGTSGSGKTTLIKLLLGFYEPQKGKIKLGDIYLNNISNRMWRDKCGVVMQDGFIFSDSIANNISVSDEFPDREKLLNAVKVANIQDFIESLPLGYNTKIGQNGVGLSQGQKQRILIARAVYKNPEFIFLDEATNALDANNERVIMENLDQFFKGKTVVVVAHRLSTVKNADQIVVLEQGKIVERGTHAELTRKKGAYYELVRNQLELGN